MSCARDDVIGRALPFLEMCGACDASLPMTCTCPTGDYRTVMLDLVKEVERFRRLHPEPAITGPPARIESEVLPVE